MNMSSASLTNAASHETGQVFDRIAWRIMPLLVLCYLSAFLDRVNVGFAALTMRADIGLSATAFGLGSGIFFLPYFLLEVPSNLALARFGARRWIARIMISWGIISAATAFVWNGPSFLAVRLLLGAAEAGFYPGILVYLTTWFPDRRRAQIIALLLLSNPLATILGGPISGLLLSMDHHGALQSWQWLFLLEAIPPMLLGVIVLYLLPDRIEDARWLAPDEASAVRQVLDADLSARHKTARIPLRQVFHHPQILALAFIFFGISMTNATVNFWLPQMIKGSGFGVVATGFLTAIPYIAGVLGLLVWGRRSDRRGERRFHIIAPLLLAAAGVIFAAISAAPLPRILGLTISASGLFAVLPVYWTLPPLLMVGSAAAAGIAVINSIGNLGGFFGPSVMGYMRDRTGSFGAGLMVDAVMRSWWRSSRPASALRRGGETGVCLATREAAPRDRRCCRQPYPGPLGLLSTP
jgi:MFS transporter, ACS family, tartrate transporter